MAERPKSIDAVKLDRNMTLNPIDADGLKWLSPLEQPFRLAGFPWLQRDRAYRRLPVTPEHPLPPAVDTLANCTAGGQIRFRTDSSRLLIRVRLTGPGSMYHMPATGQCGFDCYLGEIGSQRFLSTARFDPTKTEYETEFYNWNAKKDCSVTLNFPLYQGVEEVWIGVDADAAVSGPAPYASDRPIVIYGTSITQGGCATRPGMAYPNIMSRSIPYEFINLGFSGNGKGEPEVARVVAGIDNPAMLVLDYEANSGTYEDLERTLPEFIRILRERHPEVPLLVISNIRYAGDSFYESMLTLHERRRQLQIDIVDRRRHEGDRHIHFVDGFTLLGDDACECTVDGVHPTDLGFYRMAKSLEPVFKSLLGL